MIKDSLFQNEFFFQSYFFVLFIKENQGGQNYPANGAIMKLTKQSNKISTSMQASQHKWFGPHLSIQALRKV